MKNYRGRADFFSFSLYFRPAKKAKTAFNNITIGKEGHKDQMCNNLFFSLFVADIIILFLKHFFKFQLFFSKNSFENSFVCFDLWAVERNGIYFHVKITQPWSPFMVPNRVNSEKFEFFVNSS